MSGAAPPPTATDIARFEAACPGVVAPPLASRLARLTAAALAAAATVWTFDHLGFSVARWAEGLAELGFLVQFMLPPAHNGWLGVFVYGMLETIAMAFLGTAFGALVALPFGFLCARTVVRSQWIHFPLRRVFDLIRGVDALIWALIFVNVVGLGPFSGVLALTINNAGDMTKLFSEAVENIERRQVEGIRASGGGRFAVLRLGMLPQILPTLLSQILYHFESNTRSATIIGVVGAGGVGLLITERIRLNLWDEVAFLILMILVAVAAIDHLSKWVRETFIRGRPAPMVA